MADLSPELVREALDNLRKWLLPVESCIKARQPISAELLRLTDERDELRRRIESAPKMKLTRATAADVNWRDIDAAEALIGKRVALVVIGEDWKA